MVPAAQAVHGWKPVALKVPKVHGIPIPASARSAGPTGVATSNDTATRTVRSWKRIARFSHPREITVKRRLASARSAAS
jgi:hypothetical protein